MLTRSQWGARDPNAKPAYISIKSRTGFCTHYDGGTPINLKTLADVIAQVRKDQNFHMDGRGWNDIGYNFLVVSAPDYPAIDGMVVEGRGRDIIGAHCEGHNTPWIGVQVAIGGDQEPSPKALASVRSLYDEASTAHGSPLGKFGHRDGYNTACPGPRLYAWVQAGMPAVALEDEDMAIISKESQDWIEARLDAHSDFVLANLKATLGREVLAAIQAVATGLDPSVQKAVADALAAHYDATVSLKPKE